VAAAVRSRRDRHALPQGLATALELTDANDSRFEAEVGYTGAQFSMALAYLALARRWGSSRWGRISNDGTFA